MITRFISACALMATAATPCMGQTSDFAPTSYRNGALAGVYVRIALDRKGVRPVLPQLGLRVAAAQDFRDPLTGQGSVTDRDVVDFRLSGMSRPTLLVSGRPVTGPEARTIKAIGTGEAIAIGGGVVLLLILAALAAGSPSPGACPVIDGNRDHCID